MRKLQTFFVFLIPIYFWGCSSTGFLSEENISKIKYIPSESNQVIFYKRTIKITGQNKVTVQNHFLLRIGNNTHAIPDILSFYDGSMYKLTKLNARIVRKDGTTSKFDNDDLLTRNLSNRNVISQNEIKYLPIKDNIYYGDMIEVVNDHEIVMPQLGLTFSLDEVGSFASNTELIIETPKNYKFDYEVINDSIKPDISLKEDKTIYSFRWPIFIENKNSSELSRINNYPEILIALPKDFNTNSELSKISSWKNFGDWYLGSYIIKIESTN